MIYFCCTQETLGHLREARPWKLLVTPADPGESAFSGHLQAGKAQVLTLRSRLASMGHHSESATASLEPSNVHLLVIRGFDDELSWSIHRVAQREGARPNQATLKPLRKRAVLVGRTKGADIAEPHWTI